MEKYPADEQDHDQISQPGEIILYGSDSERSGRTNKRKRTER
jgi:hypothetical protein